MVRDETTVVCGDLSFSNNFATTGKMLGNFAKSLGSVAGCMRPATADHELDDQQKVDLAMFQESQGPRRSTSILFPPVEAGLLTEQDNSDDELATPGDKSGNASPDSLPPLVDPRLIWKVVLLSDTKPDKKFCDDQGNVKPRRAKPVAKVSDFLNGLTKVGDAYVHEAELNGWPALTGFTLAAILCQERHLGVTIQKPIWKADSGKPLPKASDIPTVACAQLVAPPGFNNGWASGNPGFVFWYNQACLDSRLSENRVLFGESMVDILCKEEIKAGELVRAHTIHAFAHRYPMEVETMRDRQTIHTGILIEWDHGKHTSVLELAWRNGVGGYNARANYYEDKNAKETALCRAMGPGFKQPWDNQKTELRIYDVPQASKKEFEEYLEKYSNRSGIPLAEQRFLDPTIYASAKVRVRHCGPKELATYCLNYIRRVSDYHLVTANCQTFTADMFAFLTGKINIQPHSDIIKTLYQQHSKAFLYECQYD